MKTDDDEWEFMMVNSSFLTKEEADDIEWAKDAVEHFGLDTNASHHKEEPMTVLEMFESNDGHSDDQESLDVNRGGGEQPMEITELDYSTINLS